jgi:hypothetical protein
MYFPASWHHAWNYGIIRTRGVQVARILRIPKRRSRPKDQKKTASPLAEIIEFPNNPRAQLGIRPKRYFMAEASGSRTIHCVANKELSLESIALPYENPNFRAR